MPIDRRDADTHGAARVFSPEEVPRCRRGSAAASTNLLSQARSGLARLTPREAYRAQRAGAVLIDIRPQANREAEGDLPGAVVMERTVLEWRLDPASDARLPFASYDLHVVVVCNEGYSSSLAAATLQEVGIGRATDMIGGYRAWKAAGLPVDRAGLLTCTGSEPPGAPVERAVRVRRAATRSRTCWPPPARPQTAVAVTQVTAPEPSLLTDLRVFTG